MKIIKYILGALFLLLSPVFTFAFTDVEHNWYKDSILQLQNQGVINGFSNGSFLPNDSSTRAEILKIIMNTAKIEIQEADSRCFSDVATDVWYSKYICSGVDIGITNGYENGTFQPNGDITVLETLAFAVRAFQIDLGETQEGQEWYVKYQDFADVNSIIPQHAYTLDTLVNRGRAADMIYRLQQYNEGKKNDYKSSGCSVNPHLTSGSYTIDIGGSQRQYLLYVPKTVSQNTPMGLIVAFHGRTNSNEMVRDYMQLGGGSYGNQQTDYIVAYPAGMGTGPYSWAQYENIELFDGIISEISEKLCIDRDKVFSVGHSLGSYMSNKVSCQRGGVLRAMVGVASTGYDTDCTGPSASLILHLPGDHLSPYSSGERAYALRTEKNNCSIEEKDISLGDIQGCKQRVSCSAGNTVIFCNSYTPYLNDPHSWPKKGSDNILDFFRNIDELTQ